MSSEGVKDAIIQDDDTEEIKGPLVFSCAKCRTIVGDSLAFLTSSEEMRTITLTASSNIRRSPDVYTSKTGHDVGSTYFQFTCSNCQHLLGNYYLTTAKDLDNLREQFTFTVDSISSYQLGKAQHGGIPKEMENMLTSGISTGSKEDENGDTNKNLTSADGNSDGKDKDMKKVKEILSTLVNSTGSLNTEVNKIQHILVDVFDRLDYLERETTRSSQGSGSHGHGHRADHWQDISPQQRQSPSGTKRLRRGL